VAQKRQNREGFQMGMNLPLPSGRVLVWLVVLVLICGKFGLWVETQNRLFVQKGLFSLSGVGMLQGGLFPVQVCEQGKVLTGSLYGSDHRMG
jgi:hypothetical protein